MAIARASRFLGTGPRVVIISIVTAKILSLDEARHRFACRRADGSSGPQGRGSWPRRVTALDQALAALAACDDESSFEHKLAAFRQAFDRALGEPRHPARISKRKPRGL